MANQKKPTKMLKEEHQNVLQKVDTHGQSPRHFSGQASLDLNPGPPATSHTR